jgi:flagellar hook assembly protein FlgD
MIPEDYNLFQNYPNPFNPVTQITYSIPQQSYIVLEIFDLTGAHMKTLVDGKQNSGMQTVQWDGTDKNGILVGTGVYLYRINSNSFSQTRKMVLIK